MKIKAVTVWLALWRASDALEKIDSESIKGAGLCRSDFIILEALLNRDGLNVNNLGKIVNLTSGSISTAIDRLEKKLLVYREYSVKDRRICNIFLSHSGRDLISREYRKHEDNFEKKLTFMSQSDRRKIINLLKKIRKI